MFFGGHGVVSRRFLSPLRNGCTFQIDGMAAEMVSSYCHDDDDDSRSYVRPLLQLETVTSVLVIRLGKQFSFQITTERGY